MKMITWCGDVAQVCDECGDLNDSRAVREGDGRLVFQDVPLVVVRLATVLGSELSTNKCL